MRIYAINEIPYYWVIDPIGRTLEIFVLQDEAYFFGRRLTRKKITENELFPDICCVLREWE